MQPEAAIRNAPACEASALLSVFANSVLELKRLGERVRVHVRVRVRSCSCPCSCACACSSSCSCASALDTLVRVQCVAVWLRAGPGSTSRAATPTGALRSAPAFLRALSTRCCYDYVAMIVMLADKRSMTQLIMIFFALCARSLLLFPGNPRGTYLIRPSSGTRAAVSLCCALRCSRYSYEYSTHAAGLELRLRDVDTWGSRCPCSARKCPALGRARLCARADPRNYALSIRDEDEARGGIPVVKHYKIRTLGEARGFYISTKITFPSFGALISHYESTLAAPPLPVLSTRIRMPHRVSHRF